MTTVLHALTYYDYGCWYDRARACVAPTAGTLAQDSHLVTKQLFKASGCAVGAGWTACVPCSTVDVGALACSILTAVWSDDLLSITVQLSVLVG